MKTPSSSRPRATLLLGAYLLGTLGIIASHSSGDGGSSSSCEIEVSAIAAQNNPLGDIWAGVGTRADGISVNGVLRLAVSGSTVASYTFADSSDASLVTTLAVAVDGLHLGDVYVGGDFDRRILRLNSDATPDSGFAVGSGFDGRVNSIVAADDGSGDIYVGGDFDNYNGTPVGGLVRLRDDGSLDNAFIATIANVESVALATDAPLLGYVYTAGRTLPTAARWASNGRLDSNFNPITNAVFFSVAAAANGSGAVYFGGNAPVGVLRLNQNGGNDAGFVGSGFDARILDLLLAGDSTGDIYVAGEFTVYDGSSANGLIRLADDGTRRASFDIGRGFTDASDSPVPVNSIAGAVDGSTDIYAGGGFSFYDRRQIKGIARLNDDGSLDEGFALQLPVGEDFCNGRSG